MNTLNASQPSVSAILNVLSEYPAGCDSEFDAAYEELERQFAELRLHFPAHEGR